MQQRLNAGSLPQAALIAAGSGEVLRYGENPHQQASLYRFSDAQGASLARARVLSGKALSFNNLLDLDGALSLICEFEEPTVAVIKHSNPCGCASSARTPDALRAAWAGDPVSAFGSILAFNRELDLESAKFLTDGGRFVECVIAPAYDGAALEWIHEQAKWGKNVRLLELPEIGPAGRDARDFDVKKITGGLLVQDRDLAAMDSSGWEVVTREKPTPEQARSAEFAWRVCKHVKSNAIVVVSGTELIGAGAGQMSRVDSVEIACRKAGERIKASTLASDAFFPFADGVEKAAAAGVEGVRATRWLEARCGSGRSRGSTRAHHVVHGTASFPALSRCIPKKSPHRWS